MADAAVSWEIREGDARERLRELDAESVQTCVTSPPYWGLRDYGTAAWEGGSDDCQHRVGGQVEDNKARDAIVAGIRPGVDASRCLDCGARRVDSQLGLEPTPEQYVENLVAVFREVRRVLRPDGTLWLNLGDSYASKARGSDVGWSKSRLTNPGTVQKAQAAALRGTGERHRGKSSGLKSKDLVGIPWMVAFALRADGWYLRRDVIWSKPNPMPESVIDRPTSSHEYLFLLAKSERYYYDAEAIREPDSGQDHARTVVADQPSLEPSGGVAPPHSGLRASAGRAGLGRNRRSVWTIATRPFPDAHFATFPPDLIEPCVLAGSPPECCSDCGAPWRRLVDVSYENPGNRTTNGPRSVERKSIEYGTAGFGQRLERRGKTIGWEPTCDHHSGGGRSTVLDPFAGAGTTGLVALRHDRSFVGIELSPEYAEMARDRIRDDAPLLNAGAEAA